MKQLKALVVDDEIHAMDGLIRLLKAYCPDVEVIGGAGTVEEGIQLLAEFNPELIFLDVQLKDKNGFDLVEAARTRNCSIVFVTAHREYAAHAFRVDAVDYLLKPVYFKDLQVAVARTFLRREQENSTTMHTDYRVRISASTGIRFMHCRDIVAIEGDGRYSTIYTVDREEQIVSRNIGGFEQELEPHGFFRVHKSWLINCVHVVRILNVDGGTVELTNGKKVLLSRRKKNEFLKRMER